MYSTTLATDYYQKFVCTGSACPLHCCQNWSITLSRTDYTKIRSAKKGKELAARLQEGMKRNKDSNDEKYAYFTTAHQTCAMLNADGLCALQAECGAGVLPNTCKIFPRLLIAADTTLFRSCTAGCPEIMKELVLRGNVLTFTLYEEKIINKLRILERINNDLHPQTGHYLQILEVCIDLLQNRTVSLRERIMRLGMAMRALDALEQDELQNGVQTDGFNKWKQQYDALSAIEQSTIDFEEIDVGKTLLNNATLAYKICTAENNALLNETMDRVMKTMSITRSQVSPSAAMTNTEGHTLVGVNVNLDAYRQARIAFYQACDVDAMMENIMINYLVGSGFPLTGKGIWPSYLYFCQLYSYLHFVAVGSYTKEDHNLDGMIRDLTICYRSLVHNVQTVRTVCDIMEQNGCNTLAHMAMLVNG